MTFDRRYRLPASSSKDNPGYIATKYGKDLIVLHFTAGPNAAGALRTWQNAKIRIGTDYILDRDGTVYEIFDPKYTAWHLGMKQTQANEAIESESRSSMPGRFQKGQGSTSPGQILNIRERL